MCTEAPLAGVLRRLRKASHAARLWCHFRRCKAQSFVSVQLPSHQYSRSTEGHGPSCQRSHIASGRIGGLIDDVVCKMRDAETMTVASLLSRLFIHAAVPEEISSLEAWHVLLQTGYFLWTSFGSHQVPAPPPVDQGADWRWTVDSGALREGEESLPCCFCNTSCLGERHF